MTIPAMAPPESPEELEEGTALHFPSVEALPSQHVMQAEAEHVVQPLGQAVQSEEEVTEVVL